MRNRFQAARTDLDRSLPLWSIFQSCQVRVALRDCPRMSQQATSLAPAPSRYLAQIYSEKSAPRSDTANGQCRTSDMPLSGVLYRKWARDAFSPAPLSLTN